MNSKPSGLTEAELHSIRDEAEKLYPNNSFGSALRQEVYILALTKEREKVKELVTALETMVKQFSSTNNNWNELSAIEHSQTAISNYQNKTP